MVTLSSVPKLNLEEDDEEVSLLQADVKLPKRRGKSKIWINEATFENFEEAEAFVKAENSFARFTSNATEDGQKIVYRCNKVPFKKRESCPAALYLLLHAESQKVTLFRTDEEHQNHTATWGMHPDVKSTVNQLLTDGIRRPKAILESLRLRNLPEPSLRQLTNYLSRLRTNQFGGATINVSELTEWCIKRKTVPDDEDQAFVVDFNISAEDINTEPNLQIFLSTKRLFKIALKSSVIQTDATYKLNWQGYPVLLVGTSDKNRQFHPFGVAICYSETSEDFEHVFRYLKEGIQRVLGEEYVPTVLLADASEAITNGFKAVFGDNFTRLMCWFHVIKNLDSKLRCLKGPTAKTIRDDIETLQLCGSDDTFKMVGQLMLQKWKNLGDSLHISNEKIFEFIDYFDQSWFQRSSKWYEGACLTAPSTNNSLEATNSVIKKEYTFRERLPMGQFLDIVENKLIHQWSSLRDPNRTNSKNFATEPSVSLELWTKSYEWAKGGINVLTEKQDEIEIYYIPSSKFLTGDEIFSHDTIKLLQESHLKWISFMDYKHKNSLMWTAKFNKTEWMRGACNCPSYMKHSMCKHIVGLALRLGLVNAPPEAKNIPLGQKRKRGRPSKAKAALVKQ